VGFSSWLNLGVKVGVILLTEGNSRHLTFNTAANSKVDALIGHRKGPPEVLQFNQTWQHLDHHFLWDEQQICRTSILCAAGMIY
jgi:hypothetical protein